MATPGPAGAASVSFGADDEVKKRVGKKLVKKRFETNAPAIELPERLKEGDDSREEDLVPTQGPPMFMNMNQSIFGLIAAAGSRVDFHDRFESSDDDSGDEPDHDRQRDALDDKSRGLAHLLHRRQRRPDAPQPDLSKTTVLKKDSSSFSSKSEKHRRKISGSKLLRSLPALPRLPRHKSKKEKSNLKSPSSDEVTHPFEARPSQPTDHIREEEEGEEEEEEEDDEDGRGHRLAPVMSRMLEAKAEMSARPSFDIDRLSADQLTYSDSAESNSTALARRLQDIFEFDHPEAVIEEYPCWLLQSVLLQGYMYITAKHICFYAYLPKKAHEVVKSGYLSKSGKRNPKYNRYWFRLKGDVLAYYKDPSNVYFPSGQIDLRYGISASVNDRNDGLGFTVVTHHRTYHFKADSAPSAKEWVKSLQRVIFRSHNEGDSVKISLPIENVIDIEDTQMLEFADTCKIRVIDNDETYAIDEYFFSFFSFGKDAINVLKILIEDASSSARDAARLKATQEHEERQQQQQQQQQQQPVAASARSSTSVSRRPTAPLKLRTNKLPDAVKATLSPLSTHSPSTLSPRASMDAAHASFDAFRGFRRRSLDLSTIIRDSSPRRSFSGNRRSMSRNRLDESRHTPRNQGSTDSYVQSSMEDPSFSGMVASSSEDPSASQILRRSDVFQNPTMHRSASVSRTELEKNQQREPRSPPALAAYSGQRAATTGSINDGDKPPATPTLQTITKMGAFPLQRVGAFAEYLNNTGSKLGSMLATESMGYVEKVSGMWRGGRKHYDAPPEIKTDDEDLYEDAEGKIQTSMDRFRAHFALPETEKLQATYFGYILRVLPLYGKIYISDKSFCFRSLLPGTRTKLILPLKDIENVDKEKGFRFGYSGLVIVIRGHEEVFFEFGQAELRDDCAVTLLQSLETTRYLKETGDLDMEEKEEEENAMAERDALKEARQVEEFHDHELRLPKECAGASDAPTILFDDPKASFLNFKPSHSMKITCLTIGSRGDVQPYIALCKGLIAEGHKPRIATHAEFKDWIEGHGIEFAKVDGDPGELMRLCIENGTFTWAFLKEANSMFRGWLDELLVSAWEACQGSDLLIESPSAMAGIHIAEKLSIPYFRAFTMPWTRTRAYPHAFVMPEYKMGGAYNYMTYVMFDNIFWKATAHQINRWRNNTLKLPNTSLEKMQPNKVPFLYNFSEYVVAPPLDFSDWIRVTGYWFLDEGSDFRPPKELTDFIAKARADEKKLVYVGFGSIIVNDTAKMTQEVIDAVLKADVRCILSKGWSDRVAKAEDAGGAKKDEPVMPPEIFVIKSAPHDWLFSQIDAAAHHGGSGTTGASLRAGIPTIIRPFFGDQFFFGARVEDIGVGICLKKWGAVSFARALWEATHNDRMIVKARVLGEQIRSERGVENAIQCIYRDMEYATSLIKRKAGKHAHAEEYDDEEEAEESWTFVGSDEPDPDMTTKKLSEMGGVPGLPEPKPIGNRAMRMSPSASQQQAV
ncbi:glycosyltransferase family 28 domain-containing protein [Colletotrichum navitas]|uniref:Sterol 3-beta-glucosyltransferase n=1 Tax=Colletotrichum navitas TaxID=681940 RepID=A0AAD8V5M2_9PEZI|nr:glycosyltransferase family 28 domain-containing protein [Colletotrichum navitas]KAK1593508.1 glycosyltransferase family 28 domain-containing protein [Colletotrichum navitas]